METLSVGMMNIRLSQFFAERRTPTRDDLERIQNGLQFVRRSLAGVKYLEQGDTEGLEEDSLRSARYARRTVRERPRRNETSRDVLESIEKTLRALLDDPTTAISAQRRRRLEEFFASVGEKMVSESIEADFEHDEWPTNSPVECLL